MPTITSVVTSGSPGDTATIHGSGFGSSQGTSILLFFPISGDFNMVVPTSWSGTAIGAVLPPGADVGSEGFFAVILNGSGDAGVRSAPFVIGQPLAMPAASVLHMDLALKADATAFASGADHATIVPATDPYGAAIAVCTAVPGDGTLNVMVNVAGGGTMAYTKLDATSATPMGDAMTVTAVELGLPPPNSLVPDIGGG